jgi:hypothetical protein
LPDIFDEVEEDLRAERAQSFLRRFGGLLGLGVVAVLVATGAYVIWSQQRQAASDAAADQFLAAAQLADKSVGALSGVDKATASQAAAGFAKLAADGPRGYRVLSRLRLAALQWELGETAQAIATWKSVSDDTSAPPLLRDFATVASGQHQADSADPAQLKQTMETVTGADNPWRPVAEQVIAVLDLRQGKTREAADILRRLSTDPTAPEGVRQMTADLVSTLPAPPAPTPGATASTPAPGASTSAPMAGATASAPMSGATAPAPAPGAIGPARPPGAVAATPAPSAASPGASAPQHARPTSAGAPKPAPHG